VVVERTGNLTGVATVRYDTSDGTALGDGTDYFGKVDQTLTFAAGVTSQNILITINGDTINEDDETFNITLSIPTQTVGVASITGTNPHVVTIANDDISIIGFASAGSSVAEGGGPSYVQVTRSDTNGTAMVDYVTANGAWPNTAFSGVDYTATSGTLNFADGVGSMIISVVILDDANNEDDEEFTVTLSNESSQYGVVALGTSVHTVTITDDDHISIYFNDAASSVAEGDSGTSTHTVTVKRDDTWGWASVDYETVDGTATAGTDYTGISTTTLTFADTVDTATIDVVITGDTTVELDETFTITLSNPLSEHGDATVGSDHTVTITNDDTHSAAFCISGTGTAHANQEWVVAGGVGDPNGSPTWDGYAQYRNPLNLSGGDLYMWYDTTNSEWTVSSLPDGQANPGGNYFWTDGPDMGGDPWDEYWTGCGSCSGFTIVQGICTPPATTTTAAGSYYQVSDCTSALVSVIDDPYNLFTSLSVGDVVYWTDTNTVSDHCGEIFASGVGGTSVGDIQGVEDFNMTPYDCSTCNSDNGL
jgi:hypothetical protein